MRRWARGEKHEETARHLGVDRGLGTSGLYEGLLSRDREWGELSCVLPGAQEAGLSNRAGQRQEDQHLPEPASLYSDAVLASAMPVCTMKFIKRLDMRALSHGVFRAGGETLGWGLAFGKFTFIGIVRVSRRMRPVRRQRRR